MSSVGCCEGAEPGEFGVQQDGPGAVAGEVHDDAPGGSGEPRGGREQPLGVGVWVPSGELGGWCRRRQ